MCCLSGFLTALGQAGRSFVVSVMGTLVLPLAGLAILVPSMGLDGVCLMPLLSGIANAVYLVGHDFGAVVGWTAVVMHPEKIISWTALSVPYWPAYFWAIQNDPEQQKKGAYVKMFQEPGRPEQILAANDYAALRKLWTGFDEKIIKEYLGIFSSDKALTSVAKRLHVPSIIIGLQLFQ